jgi:hypothetical protein
MSSAAAPGSHVFLVRSSLQFLLATALAVDQVERTQQPCRMLFLPDLPDPGLFLRAAAQCIDSPFDGVVIIEPRQRSAAIRRELRAQIAVARPLSLTVFNDREEAGQTVLIATAGEFPQARRRCAEDGSLAYSDFVFRGHSAITQLRQALRVGRKWSNVRVLGTHPLVQDFIALHPQLLREQLRGRRIQAFPASALDSPALRSLARALCADAGFDAGSVPADAAILTLSHSSYAQRNPEYVQMVAACAQKLTGRQERFFVKYHPRESHPDYLKLCAAGGAEQIPRSVPAECLYLTLRDRPLTIIGGMSTALLTAGLLMPKVRCAALMHATQSGETWDRRLLDELRITPLNDAAAINAYFYGTEA